MAEEQTTGGSPPEESGGVNRLTSISRRIHCGATPDVEFENELDQIAIDSFLDTLAEVAMAAIRRRGQLNQ